jgi:hypothetical protein
MSIQYPGRVDDWVSELCQGAVRLTEKLRAAGIAVPEIRLPELGTVESAEAFEMLHHFMRDQAVALFLLKALADARIAKLEERVSLIEGGGVILPEISEEA